MPIRPVKELVAEAKTQITTLSVTDARDKRDRGEALLVDIRDPRELKREGRSAPKGRMPIGIENIPRRR